MVIAGIGLVEQGVEDGTIIVIDMDFMRGVERAVLVDWYCNGSKTSFLTMFVVAEPLPFLLRRGVGLWLIVNHVIVVDEWSFASSLPLWSHCWCCTGGKK